MALKLFDFKATVTVLIGLAYLVPLIWAVYHDKIEVSSYIAGVGPSFGGVVAHWFKGSDTQP